MRFDLGLIHAGQAQSIKNFESEFLIDFTRAMPRHPLLFS